MAEISLQGPGICPLVCQCKTGGMTQHMRMDLEGQFGLDASPLDPEVENGAPRSDTKMKGDLASRFKARNALSSSPSNGCAG